MSHRPNDMKSVQKAKARIFFVWNKQFSLPKPLSSSFFLSNSIVGTVRFESTPSDLFFLKLMFDRSKLESLCDVSVTRIGDTLSYGSPQTELVNNSYIV